MAYTNPRQGPHAHASMFSSRTQPSASQLLRMNDNTGLTEVQSSLTHVAFPKANLCPSPQAQYRKTKSEWDSDQQNGLQFSNPPKTIFSPLRPNTFMGKFYADEEQRLITSCEKLIQAQLNQLPENQRGKKNAQDKFKGPVLEVVWKDYLQTHLPKLFRVLHSAYRINKHGIIDDNEKDLVVVDDMVTFNFAQNKEIYGSESKINDNEGPSLFHDDTVIARIELKWTLTPNTTNKACKQMKSGLNPEGVFVVGDTDLEFSRRGQPIRVIIAWELNSKEERNLGFTKNYSDVDLIIVLSQQRVYFRSRCVSNKWRRNKEFSMCEGPGVALAILDSAFGTRGREIRSPAYILQHIWPENITEANEQSSEPDENGNIPAGSEQSNSSVSQGSPLPARVFFY